MVTSTKAALGVNDRPAASGLSGAAGGELGPDTGGNLGAAHSSTGAAACLRRGPRAGRRTGSHENDEHIKFLHYTDLSITVRGRTRD